MASETLTGCQIEKTGNVYDKVREVQMSQFSHCKLYSSTKTDIKCLLCHNYPLSKMLSGDMNKYVKSVKEYTHTHLHLQIKAFILDIIIMHTSNLCTLVSYHIKTN